MYVNHNSALLNYDNDIDNGVVDDIRLRRMISEQGSDDIFVTQI